MKVRNIAAGLILCMAAAGCARYLAEHAEVSSNVNGRELPISSVETKEPKIALTFDVAWESADLEGNGHRVTRICLKKWRRPGMISAIIPRPTAA